MDEMKRENEALRAKLRSCSKLNSFYHETQQEIDHVNQLLTSKNGIIADLRARLGKYEKTVVMEGEEPYIVGPSKSLIESLCKEICKLKQKVKESETEVALRLESSKAVSYLLCLYCYALTQYSVNIICQHFFPQPYLQMSCKIVTTYSIVQLRSTNA